MRLINNPEIVHFLLFPCEVRFCKIQKNKRKIVIELPLQNLFDGQIFAQKSLLISFVSNLIFFLFLLVLRFCDHTCVLGLHQVSSWEKGEVCYSIAY